jgi:hypothetical protein
MARSSQIAARVKKAARQAQPALFDLKEDRRPQSQRMASSRYEESTLFD